MIRVKFFTKDFPRFYRRQLPSGQPVWGQCEYLFDPEEREYDWLVVYDDMPSYKTGKVSLRKELLACPRQHTLLVTTEPSNIKVYGRAYVDQFGHVLTSQEPWALRHPHRIYSQAGLRWFYGAGTHHEIPYDRLTQMEPRAKTRMISTVCSTKQQKHTLHHRRYQFVQDLKALMPELEIFGHGVREMDDKAEALDDYRYHIAIENHVAPHHWTEKLSDAFLGYTLPFYYGCPNAAEYFPPNSFIPIDIHDVPGARDIIRQAINNNEYEKRLPDILEARKRVLEQYNLFAVLSGIIESQHQSDLPVGEPFVMLSRRAARKKYPAKGIMDLLQKAGIQARNRIRNMGR